MNFTSNLYVDEESKKILLKKHYLSRKENSVYDLPLVCVYFPEKGTRMEYCEIEFLRFKYYRTHEPLIIGFAENTDNALAIVKDIVEQTVDTGDEELNYRAFVEKDCMIVKDLKDVKGFFIISPEAIMNEEEEGS